MFQIKLAFPLLLSNIWMFAVCFLLFSLQVIILSQTHEVDLDFYHLKDEKVKQLQAPAPKQITWDSGRQPEFRTGLLGYTSCLRTVWKSA